MSCVWFVKQSLYIEWCGNDLIISSNNFRQHY